MDNNEMSAQTRDLGSCGGSSLGPLPNRYGHQFGKPYNEGYATCGLCGTREDSFFAARPCTKEIAK